ncbi:hypothetical protein EVAR_23254_1 [Eumeta japonica]|uniref:Uncharacterized protein n=1 Tax=Eumeta variegata TaxID=151549 RepID=A0A4C1V513_EUMVA|nr:hypothetical protein EVAR_23254_1 [Eumeta japonica]
MEEGFTQANSTNLSRVDLLMLSEILASNKDFCSAEFRNVKSTIAVSWNAVTASLNAAEDSTRGCRRRVARPMGDSLRESSRHSKSLDPDMGRVRLIYLARKWPGGVGYLGAELNVFAEEHSAARHREWFGFTEVCGGIPEGFDESRGSVGRGADTRREVIRRGKYFFLRRCPNAETLSRHESPDYRAKRGITHVQ